MSKSNTLFNYFTKKSSTPKEAKTSEKLDPPSSNECGTYVSFYMYDDAYFEVETPIIARLVWRMWTEQIDREPHQ